MNETVRTAVKVTVLSIVILTLPIPFVLMQRLPEPDLKTARALAAATDAQVTAVFGKITGPEFLDTSFNLSQSASYIARRNSSIARTMDALCATPAAGSEILNTDLDRIIASERVSFEAWERMMRTEGAVYAPFADFYDGLEAMTSSSFPRWRVWYQSLPELQRFGGNIVSLRAARAMAEGDWDGAVEDIELLLDAVWQTRPAGSYWFAWSGAEASANNALAAALLYDAPDEVLEKLLARLVRERDRPRFKRSLLCSIDRHGQFIPEVISMRLDGIGGAGVLFRHADAVFEILRDRERITDPRLRARAESLIDRFAPGFRDPQSDVFLYHPYEFYSLIARSPEMNAATIPATLRFVREVAAKENIFAENTGLSAEELKNLDPWTVSLLQVSRENSPSFYAQTWERKEATRRRLIEVSIASHLFRSRNGRWPSDISEVIPSILPHLGDPDPESAPAAPMLPVECGVINLEREEYTGGVVSGYGSEWSSINFTNRGNEASAEGHHWRVRPTAALAFADGLRRTGMFEDVRTVGKTVQPIKQIDIDPGLARRMADARDRKDGYLEADEPEDPGAPPLPGFTSVRVTARFTPKKVFAVWSFGGNELNQTAVRKSGVGWIPRTNFSTDDMVLIRPE